MDSKGLSDWKYGKLLRGQRSTSCKSGAKVLAEGTLVAAASALIRILVRPQPPRPRSLSASDEESYPNMDRARTLAVLSLGTVEDAGGELVRVA